jgi:predicted DNA binding CopG/RHH family protein
MPASAAPTDTAERDQQTIDDNLFHFPDDEKALDDLLNGPPLPIEALGRSTPITIRIDRVTLQRLKALAAKRGTRYQTLMKQLVLERLYEEEKRTELGDR